MLNSKGVAKLLIYASESLPRQLAPNLYRLCKHSVQLGYYSEYA